MTKGGVLIKITKRHKEAIKLLIEGRLNKEEIARSVKVARQTLYNWMNDSDFMNEYNEQLAEVERMVKRRIHNLVNNALDRQERILTKSMNDAAAASVAKDVLDRAGYGKKTAEENIEDLSEAETDVFGSG